MLQRVSALIVLLFLVATDVLVASEEAAVGTASVEVVVAAEVDAPRPLQHAAEEIQYRFGVPVTYEDPAYSYASELQDASHLVPGREALVLSGDAAPLVMPRDGILATSFRTTLAGVPLDDPQDILEQLVLDHGQADNPGRFELRVGDGWFSIVPTHRRGKQGVLIPETPVLDTVIELQPIPRSGLEAVNSILVSLGTFSGTKINIGAVVDCLANATTVIGGHPSRPARDYLREVLDVCDERTTWQLIYDPNALAFFLNLGYVRKGNPYVQYQQGMKSTFVTSPFQ